jgi:hypothetical protein
MRLMPLIVFAGVAYAVMNLLDRPVGAGASSMRRLPAPRRPPVRDAGTREMRDRPAQWDEVDEAVDESFPASDPPSTY